VVATAHAERVWGWLLMGGTLTKELVVCVGVSTCAGLLLVPSGSGAGWVWWNIAGWVSGSSSTLLGPQVTGHVVVVPGTGRSVDREPLTGWWVGGSGRVGVVGCLRTAQWTRASLK